jgi:hypothetical protein
MDLMDLSAFAVTGNSPSSRIKVAELSVEDARVHVRVVDGNIKKPVEGFQGLTLKLGRAKVSLNEVFPKAGKLQIPVADVEAASEQLVAAVLEGKFDAGIEAALVKLNEPVTTTKTTAAEPSDSDFEPLEEEAVEPVDPTEEG